MTLTETHAVAEDRLAVALAGDLTEATTLDALAAAIEGHPGEVTLDLLGIRRINSMGVKVWVELIDRLSRGPRPDRIALHRCSVPFVTQLNMVRGVRGALRVASIVVPFLCPACEKVLEVVVDVTRGRPSLVPPVCTCGEDTELDAVEAQFLAFLG